ncbi:MAG: hypothetical protein KAI76_05180 [Alphaproteobacteria bacterium]|nr:hypothetical protein [Alphaproteobacteria bacterium]
MDKWIRKTTLLFLFFCGILSGGIATAQMSVVSAEESSVKESGVFFRGSFFMTPMEIVTIQRALSGKASSNATLKVAKGEIPAHRIIRVSGVVYRTADDWIVWMNGQKVTPEKLLPEIIDIKVKDSSKINLKWYDIGLNKVISITLRPHQTYDIPTGILLPGAQ